MIVEECLRFEYRFNDIPIDQLVALKWNDPKGGIQHTVPVVVQRSRVLRTRAMFSGLGS